MDRRLAAHVIATAALTVTLATVPVLFADASHAASDPSAALTAATSPAPSAGGSAALPALPPLGAVPQTPAPAARPRHARLHAAAAGPCSDAHQVGRTRHALYRGLIAFSVREYYSPACHSYYGYSFAWRQFRRLHVRYDVGAAVFDTKHDTIDGARTFVGGAGGPSFWSAAVKAEGGDCVQGEGHYFYYPAGTPGGFIEADTLTPEVCA